SYSVRRFYKMEFMKKKAHPFVTIILIIISFWLGRVFFPVPPINTQIPPIGIEPENTSWSNANNITAEQTISRTVELPEPNIVESDLANDISRLQFENADLQQRLDDINEKARKQKVDLQFKIASLQTRLMEAEMVLSQNNLSIKRLSLDELKEHIPSPFAEIIASSPGGINDIAEFITQEKDLEWALHMQQRISDYIVTHPLSYAVSLHSVECRTLSCQILGFDKKDNSFSTIMSDIKLEPWFDLRLVSSSSGYPTEQGKMYRSIMELKN
ncbi:MAG: hypothetical protein WA981_13875, partial [Glaciecola sp.]